MLRLPKELVLSIATALESDKDVNALNRVNRQLFEIIDPFLYQRDAKRLRGSALNWAAVNGRRETALKALEAGHDDTSDAFFLSAKHGHEFVVKLLLNAKKPEIDTRDHVDRTPLYWAAENGHESVVKLLLDTGSVEIDARDRYGTTPLSAAAANGHESIVRLLLSTGKVEIDSRDMFGVRPVHHAADNGHESIVKLLMMNE
ncbi:hypothetical protein NW762_009095 [Fusarium torreyae]|uniref:F-box domain-containing protein n=1 Tax=Fusarium torreyae TaxID=1237075 RepID=A0A9W8RWM9_9HYPO|nr:hypothetical protein NW762_009095 [Fusarium torreyae]